MIDITQLLVGLIGLLLTAVTSVLLPKLTQFIKGRLSEKQIDIILKLSEQAVRYAEENMWQQAGKEKRAVAVDFITGELVKYNMTVDTDVIHKYLDSAVQQFIR